MASQDEPQKVFHEFLQIIASPGRLKYHIAPNSALDWFNRSIRGPLRIQNLFTQEIASNYEHIEFSSGTCCEPIEAEMGSKHLATMKMPTGHADDLIHPRNKTNNFGNLKSCADSDMECEAEDTVVLQTDGYKTPEPKVTLGASLAEANSQIESDSEVDETTSQEPIKRKRLKLNSPSKSFPCTSSRRLPTKKGAPTYDIGYCEDGTEATYKIQNETTASLASQTEPAVKYSGLHYVEATGILRCKKKLNDSLSGTESNDEWERRVRIRLSYRRSLKENDLVFALILYQHVEDAPSSLTKKPLARRRLDFDIDSDDDCCDEAQCSQKAGSPASGSQRNAALLALQTDKDAGVTIMHDDVGASGFMNKTVTDVMIASVENPTRGTVAAPLESAELTREIPPILRTPTKTILIPPGTPKRKPRSALRHEDDSRNNSPLGTLSPTPRKASPPKRSASRKLRL